MRRHCHHCYCDVTRCKENGVRRRHPSSLRLTTRCDGTQVRERERERERESVLFLCYCLVLFIGCCFVSGVSNYCFEMKTQTLAVVMVVVLMMTVATEGKLN